MRKLVRIYNEKLYMDIIQMNCTTKKFGGIMLNVEPNDINDINDNTIHPEVIKVIGVGGGGVNAVDMIMKSSSSSVMVEYIVMNTDAQSLRHSVAPIKLQLGPTLTKGRGAGGKPIVGKKSAEESKSEIEKLVEGADMVFITTGMGGGTGTGAAPIVAQIAKSMDILTVAIVTKPAEYEGKRRIDQADEGIEELKKYVDTIIIIPNDKMFEIASPDIGMGEVFRLGNQVLTNAVNGITDIIEKQGLVNVDLADIRTVMEDKGVGHLGVGTASGENRALRAVEEAVNSPLLETSIEGAGYALVSIIGNVPHSEFQTITQYITKYIDNSDLDLKNGFTEDLTMEDEIRVVVIATGFKEGFEFRKDKKKKIELEPSFEVDGNKVILSDDEEEKHEEISFVMPPWIQRSKGKKR